MLGGRMGYNHGDGCDDGDDWIGSGLGDRL